MVLEFEVWMIQKKVWSVSLKRNPTTSVVAVEDDKIVGAILCGHDGRRGVSIMSVWMKHTACAESEKQWLYLQWKH